MKTPFSQLENENTPQKKSCLIGRDFSTALINSGAKVHNTIKYGCLIEDFPGPMLTLPKKKVSMILHTKELMTEIRLTISAKAPGVACCFEGGGLVKYFRSG